MLPTSFPLFENDVKMYGTQTLYVYRWAYFLFENDVKMYGTQTIVLPFGTPPPFENDVKMYGTQTVRPVLLLHYRLRMM